MTIRREGFLITERDRCPHSVMSGVLLLPFPSSPTNSFPCLSGELLDLLRERPSGRYVLISRTF